MQAQALPSRVVRLEDHKRRDDLRINGVAGMSAETNQQFLLKVRDIVKNISALDDSVVLSVFRTGCRNNNFYTRIFIARLSTQEGRIECLWII